jgi:hypothetical protein
MKLSKTPLILVLLVVAVGVGLGQWTIPTTLGTASLPWTYEPVIVPVGADTTWIIWVDDQSAGNRIVTRCGVGDSWGPPEFASGDSSEFNYPSGIVADSGRVLLGWYEGSYPTLATPNPDSWAIYTATRLPASWSHPQLVFPMGMLTGSVPMGIRLGRGLSGGIGMVWSETPGVMNSMDSVMFSRHDVGGWTAKKCLAPGRYPDVDCRGASLIPGSSTEFVIAFDRWTTAGGDSIQVWTLTDSLVARVAAFPGRLPLLAHGSSHDYLVLLRGDTLCCSINSGGGWTQPAPIATGVNPYHSPAIAGDISGWASVCWVDSIGHTIWARYCDGQNWTLPEIVMSGPSLFRPAIAVDAAGTIRTAWIEYATSGEYDLRTARRTGQPGIADGSPQAAHHLRFELSPNPCRGAVRLQLTAYGSWPEVKIHDASGRLVRTLSLPHSLLSAPYSLTWDCTDNSGRAVNAGCYFCELRAGGRTIRQKLLLTR